MIEYGNKIFETYSIVVFYPTYVWYGIQVTAGGRASKAGLVAGDYILFVNGEDSKKLKHLQAQQIIKKSTHTVTLVWWALWYKIIYHPRLGTQMYMYM